jgi:hypothetical protein
MFAMKIESSNDVEFVDEADVGPEVGLDAQPTGITTVLQPAVQDQAVESENSSLIPAVFALDTSPDAVEHEPVLRTENAQAEPASKPSADDVASLRRH